MLATADTALWLASISLLPTLFLEDFFFTVNQSSRVARLVAIKITQISYISYMIIDTAVIAMNICIAIAMAATSTYYNS